MNVAAIVGRQKFMCYALGGGDVVLDSYGGVNAERKAWLGPAVGLERGGSTLAKLDALVWMQVGGDDAVSQAPEAIELGREQLAPVAGGDEDRRPTRPPGERPDGVVGELEAGP